MPGRSPLLLKDFWTTTVGFDLRRDETFGNERWIEIAPPDGGPVLILAENAQTKLAKIEARQQAAAEAAAERAGCAATVAESESQIFCPITASNYATPEECAAATATESYCGGPDSPEC